MKKLIPLFIILVLLTAMLSSCFIGGNGTEAETTTLEEYMRYFNEYRSTDEYKKILNEYLDAIKKFPSLDPDKQDLPSYDDLLKIEYEMPYEEVYAIAGLPQRKQENVKTLINPNLNIYDETTLFYYDTSDGIEFAIAYSYSGRGIHVQYVAPVISDETTAQ